MFFSAPRDHLLILQRTLLPASYLSKSTPRGSLTFIFLMTSQPSGERKPQQSPFSRLQVTLQRATTWFSKPSFFRFKLKSRPFSSSHSSLSSSNSHSSFSIDSSLSRPSTMTSKLSNYASPGASDQGDMPIKKSSPAPIAGTSTIPQSVTQQTTVDYRQPITNIFGSFPMVRSAFIKFIDCL